jgi:hypothetical protein
MSKATQVKSALVYLYGVILELQTQLAAALAQPPANQAEIDAANAKIAELQKKYDDLVAQEAADKAAEEAEEAAEKADESVLDSALGDFKKAYPNVVLEASAPVPTTEPTPVDSVAPASAIESKYVG